MQMKSVDKFPRLVWDDLDVECSVFHSTCERVMSEQSASKDQRDNKDST